MMNVTDLRQAIRDNSALVDRFATLNLRAALRYEARLRELKRARDGALSFLTALLGA